MQSVKTLLGGDPDPYSCQTHDHVSLVALAIAKSASPTGTGVHDAIRAIGNPAGTKVDSAVEGLKLLAAGKEIDYSGASGPCQFTPIGDITGCKFRFDVVENGKTRLLQLS